MTIVQKANVKSPIKHVIRQLSSLDSITPGMPYKSAATVDEEIGSLLLQGYKVISTHYLGSQKDPTRGGLEFFGILYILQLEQTEIEKRRKNLITEVEEILKKDE